MADLPTVATPEADLEHARALHRANSQIAEMRSSLSMLTSASAGLADALQKRNQQYDALLAYHGKLTQRLEAVETELKLASAERATLLEQVDERNAQLAELHAFVQAKTDLEAQLAQAESDLAASRAEVDAIGARLSELQSQADATSAEKADIEARLAAAQGELAELDTRLASWEQELGIAAPEEAPGEAAAEPVVEETQAEQVEDRLPALPPAPEEEAQGAAAQETASDESMEGEVIEAVPDGRPARLALISAAVAGAIARSKDQEVRLREAIAQVTSLQGQLEAVSAEKLSLEAGIQERDRSAAELQGQLEEVNSRLAELQAQYDATAAAKTEAEDGLQAAQQQLAALQAQMGEWQAELAGAVPEAERLAVVPVEEGAAEPAAAGEGEPAEEPGDADRVSAGISSAIAYGIEQEARLKEANAQLASLQDQFAALEAEKAALQASVQEKDQAVAALRAELDAANASIADLQSQLDAAKAAQADGEQKLQAAQVEVESLNQQLAELTGTNKALEQELQASQAEVAKFEEQLGEWQDALGEEVPEGAPEEGRGHRALAKAGLITAGITAAVKRKKEQASKMEELEKELESETAAKAGVEEQLQAMQAEAVDLKQQLASLTAAKAEADQKILAGEARVAALSELSGLEGELRGWQAELATVLPAQEERAETGAASGKAAVGMVAASITSIVALARSKDSQLRDSAAELSALHEQVGALSAQKASLEANLSGQAMTITDLQAQLDAALANKVEAGPKIETAVAEPETPNETRAESVEVQAGEGVEPLVEPATEALVVAKPAEAEPVVAGPAEAEPEALELPVEQLLAATVVTAGQEATPVETAPEPTEAIEETLPWIAEPTVAVVEGPAEEAAAKEAAIAEPAIAEPAATEVADAEAALAEPVVAAVAEVAGDKLEQVGETAGVAVSGVAEPAVEAVAVASAETQAEEIAKAQEQATESPNIIDEGANEIDKTYSHESIAKFKEKLEFVEGVDPVFAEKLRGAGVYTVLDLLQRGATRKGRAELAEASGITPELILRWVNHADLYRVKGVGSEYADLLEAAGVNTVVELAHRNPANLLNAMLETNKLKQLVRREPVASQVENWVSQAKKLPRVIQY